MEPFKVLNRNFLYHDLVLKFSVLFCMSHAIFPCEFNDEIGEMQDELCLDYVIVNLWDCATLFVMIISCMIDLYPFTFIKLELHFQY